MRLQKLGPNWQALLLSLEHLVLQRRQQLRLLLLPQVVVKLLSLLSPEVLLQALVSAGLPSCKTPVA